MSTAIHTDVLVIGAGLAGVSAAIAAARVGASVALSSAGPVFSGSSFYPGTWGFGLIGPENDADADDLKATILRVGMGMADETLVETLVEQLPRSIAGLESLGIALMRPGQGGQREYIPCFDHKCRSWYGLVQKEARTGLDKALDGLGVNRFPRVAIVHLFQRDGRVIGALGLASQGVVRFSCKSCILATGGLGGLFQYALTTSDVQGMGQYLALQAGAKLVNLEFHQMMPGYVNPCPKTVYNEKVFRYTAFLDPETGSSLFGDLPKAEVRRILEIRSGHGPFTSRLDSREVDIRLYAAFLLDYTGVPIRYDLPTPLPEFVETYFNWLRKEKGVTDEQTARLGIFYHAANGGILIDRRCFTGVEGLYACGECTGGMHGADRLGGLSTANGLVFGSIAGQTAAADALEQQNCSMEPDTEPFSPLIPEADAYLRKLQTLNAHSGMILRSQASARKALEMAEYFQKSLHSVPGTEDSPQLADSCRFLGTAALTMALHTAIGMRRESRGSHYRTDFPAPDPNYEKRILLSMDQGRIKAVFEGDSTKK